VRSAKLPAPRRSPVRPATGVERLRDAVTLLERSPARHELARALVDLGAALRRDGHRSDARAPLRDGYELARECGAQALAEDARHQLAASGVRIRRARLTGAESLTASERRIADMAAAGSSNAEIAQALFVTVKTVEMHLTHVYRKLEIPGRGELARALAS
jgi:DNA-binding CsgD family transcriptional regulator